MNLVARVGVVLNALVAVAFGALRLLAEAPPLRAVAWPGAVGLAAAYAVPAALATVALRGRRPAALLAAGLLGLPLAFSAMSGVSLVLLVPAACYLAGYATWAPRPRPRLGAAAAAGIAVAAAVGIVPLVLLVGSLGGARGYCYSWTEDLAGRRTYTQARPDGGNGLEEGAGSEPLRPGQRAAGSGCTSDLVRPGQAALAVATAAAAVAVSLRLPRAPRANSGRLAV
jgi:hypothetical protein